MTLAEFCAGLEAIQCIDSVTGDTKNMPVAYGGFAEPTTLPFSTYEMDDDDDLMADDTHFYNIGNGRLELYTLNKDEALETLVKAKLKELGVPYKKISEVWIPTEGMRQTVWAIQILE